MSESLVAIVTGGAQGLGAAITKALLKNGHKVCVGDIQEQKGKQFVEEQQALYGVHNVVFTVCDVTNEADYKRIFDFTLKEFQRIDLVVNNAGIIDEHNLRRSIDINLIGPIIGCQLALKYMGKSKGGKGGMVINTASILGFLPHHAVPIYCTTKHGVIGLTRSYGRPYHLEKNGIVFAALCPSYAETNILEKISTHSLVPGLDPHGKHVIMTPEYVAEGVMTLLEDRINGSTLLVTQNRGYQYIGLQEEFNAFEGIE